MRLRTFVRFTFFTLFLSWVGLSAAFAQDYVPGEVLVKLKGKSSSIASGQFFGKVQGKMSLKSSVSELNFHRFGLKPGGDVASMVRELKNDPAVEYAEPNYILRKFQNNDDLQFSEAISYDDYQGQAAQAQAAGFSQNYAPVRVNEAWVQMVSLQNYSERPIVAVVDTGVDYNHTIFQNTGAIWTNTGEIPNNGVDDDGNGYIDDVRGWNFFGKNNAPMDDDQHGTHVAGIILGVGQDIFASSLSQAKIRIMPLKFLGADGSGSTADAVAAIYYAVNNGAQVINNSWGGSSYSQSLHDALSYAYSRKVVVVAAAGNYSKNNDSVAMYPANYPVPSQISVAATNDSDVLASFSNYGPTTVHMSAPGVSILSTIPGNSLKFMSGTSMAAPFVSGMAALVLREAPNLSGYQVRSLILNTVGLSGTLTGRVVTGGRADVYAAIVSAKGQVSTASFQPDYKAEQRAPAAAAVQEAKPGGCGMVSSALMGARGFGSPNDPGAPGTQTLWIVVAFTLLPLIAWHLVRSKAVNKSRRRYDRYLMNSTIRVNVEGRELIGHMRTISEGGLSFEANTMLEKGGIVTMQIQSPDGRETVQVQGHIVWSEKNKAYGVQFDEAKDSVLSSIRQWSQRLVRVANY